MSMRNWVALGLSILVAGVCLYLPFVPQTVLPFDTRPLDRQHYLVRPSAYDMPLPAGLQAGDVIDARAMDVSSRLGLTTYAIPPVGTRVTLVVNREGHAFNVPVEFTRMPRIPLNLADTVSGIALIWLVAALGLLILWRGKRLAAAGVGIWCLAKLCWEIPISLPWTLPVAGWVDVSGMALYYSGTLVGLYLLAEDLVCERVPARTRRRARAAFLALVIIYLLGFVSNDLAFHLRGFWLFNPAYINARVVAHLLAFAIPIGMLVLRYRQAVAGDRARIRWVLVSIVGVVAAYLVNGTLAAFLDEYQSDILYSVFTAVASIGFTYAVLRHRLVAVNVVLNRALVYGVALTMLVAIFGVLESLLEHAALGERASLLLTLAVPLVLGILFNQLHKRFEHGMEYLFFRKQFRAEAALAQFTKECGYITSVRVLRIAPRARSCATQVRRPSRSTNTRAATTAGCVRPVYVIFPNAWA